MCTKKYDVCVTLGKLSIDWLFDGKQLKFF